jgi:DNA mismatch repair ATPase MutL
VLRERLANQTAEGAPGPDTVAVGPAIAPAPIDPAASAEAASGRSTPDAAQKAPDGDHRPASPLRLVLEADPPHRVVQQQNLGLGYQSRAAGTAGSANGGSAGPAPGLGHANGGEGTAPAPLYSELRVLGQIFAGYIALESEEGLLLVDQHAAHERVTFERLRTQLERGGVEVQAQLVPETLQINPARAAHIHAAMPKLRALGFDLEPFGPTTLLLKGTPAVFGAQGGLSLLSDMIEAIGDGGAQWRGEEGFHSLLKQLACHGSVRVGRILKDSEIQALLADLDRTPFKTNCPHGRPVHIRFPRGQIERMFRR